MLFTASAPAEAREVALRGARELPDAMADERRQLQAMADVTLIFGLDRAELTDVRRWRDVPADEVRGPGARMLVGLAAWDATQQGEPAGTCAALALRSLAEGELLSRDNGLLSIAALASLTFCDRDEVLAAWDEALADAHRHGSLFSMMAAHLWLGTALLQRGALVEAETELRQAREDFAAWGNVGGLRYCSAFLSRALLARGDLAGAREAIEIARDGGDDSDGSVFWLHASLELTLAEGRHEDVVARAREAIERFRAVPNPALTPWRSQLGEALGRLGRATRPAAGRGGARPRPPLRRAVRASPAPCACSACCGRRRRRDPAGGRRRRDRLPRPLRARAQPGRARRGAAPRAAAGDAREPLRRALELAESCGASALRDHVRAELHAAGARPRSTALSGVESLTASERRVAGLAADGGTNRDIAQALFVTPKTVEVHLSNAYRKLGVRSRRELAGALG